MPIRLRDSPIRAKVAASRAKEKDQEKARAKAVGSGVSPKIQLDQNKTNGICHMYVRHGQCSNDACPYSHLSQDQVKCALGQGGSEQRDTSRGSNDADKVSRGRGKGKGKRNRGKTGDRSPSRGKEKDVKSTLVEWELQQV